MKKLMMIGLFLIGYSVANAQTQITFASPEEAVNALIEAIEKNNVSAMVAMLGPDSENILSSGDEIADKAGRQDFLTMYQAKHSLIQQDENTMVLQVGENDWPLPIPVVKQDGKWLLDGAAGADEIVYRRIGRNELGAIAVCNEFLDAQTEYASEERDGNDSGIYAAKIWSDPGKHNGLYWPTAEGEPQSPLSDAVASAAEEGYRAATGGKRNPYHGYYYRILLAQGADASGGAMDYFVKGKLTEGVGLLAWPAEYGVSGVKTFMVNHEGIVYEKDLGDSTAVEIENIRAFNPDPGWTALDVIE